ncbi:helix-turn-helix domain-containing protein [Streptomyces mobaraensis]|uniref:Helix-turn-helix transcriptional regulator n=1 Tax=Streptomyces mobaraensis TaxID=35621 RepID=A0A5N5W3F8_STRMB|nr:helix-turn-helix transcriptional regulator [Streptomyces mobaraensis]KAB7836059.1 helix-turn-helix transcriptional regulator [Streptomyces mobaraensis]
MTDLPSELTTGERIRVLRERRGLSRPVLAGLVGRSSDWLKEIENGDRELRSITHLVRLANALRVPDVSMLTGGELSIPADGTGKLSHSAVPAIRSALHGASFTTAPTVGAITPGALKDRVVSAWRLWHTSTHQRTEVGALLPDLVRDAHACVKAHQGNERRAAHAATADLYRLVQRLLAHICEPELYWIALDRGRAHSEEADQPVALALAAWSTAIGQRAAGFAEEAVRTDEAGMEILRGELDRGDAELTSVYGALNLQAAISCGLDGRSGDAERYLAEADRTARRLPGDYSHPQSAFDASNVAVHGVGIGVGLLNPGEALRRAENIAPEKITSLERRSRLLLDIAAGHAQKRETAAAVHYLGRAHQVTPEGIRYVPTARSLAASLVRTASGPLKAGAVALAEAVGVAA